MKKICRIILIFIIAFLVIATFNCFFTYISFATNNDNNNFDLEKFENSNEINGVGPFKNLVNNSASTIISIARIVGVTIAIVILLVISMKYMIAAPGDRADIKKHAVNYVIGAIILFGVVGIVSIISNFAENIEAEDGTSDVSKNFAQVNDLNYSKKMKV